MQQLIGTTAQIDAANKIRDERLTIILAANKMLTDKVADAAALTFCKGLGLTNKTAINIAAAAVELSNIVDAKYWLDNARCTAENFVQMAGDEKHLAIMRRCQ